MCQDLESTSPRGVERAERGERAEGSHSCLSPFAAPAGDVEALSCCLLCHVPAVKLIGTNFFFNSLFFFFFWLLGFFVFFLLFILIEGKLLYGILLFSAEYQHESAIGIYTSPPLPHDPLSHPGFRCCAQAFSSCVGRGCCLKAVRWLLIMVAPLVAEHSLQARQLQWCAAQTSRRVFPGQGSKPSPALGGGFLPQRQQGSPRTDF